MTCHFTSFLTVFQSYQDDERLIMKGGTRLRRFRLGRGLNSGPLAQQASAYPTELSVLLDIMAADGHVILK